MATEKQILAYEVTLEAAKAEGSVGGFKKALRDANNELQYMAAQFGEASVEAAIAAKKVAGLKDAIGDAKALADTFSPDKKFVALGGALQGVVAGFSAVQGAMGLFGAEGKDVEKMMLKVQSAMALQQGISGMFEAADSFKMLGASAMKYSIVQKIVTIGQKIFNAVMSANPIGLLITAIAALIAAGTALFMFFSKSSAAAKENEKAVKANAKALDEQIKSRELATKNLSISIAQELAMAKATGKSTASIRALELQLIQKSLADSVASRNAALHTIELEKQSLSALKARGANEDLVKQQLETTNKAVAEYNKLNIGVQTALDERKKTINRHEVEVAQEKTNTNIKSNDKAKELAEKQAAKLIEIENNRVVQQNHSDELVTQNRLLNIKDEFTKSQMELANKTQAEIDTEAESLNKKLISKKQYDANVKLINENAQIEQAKLITDRDEKEKTESDKKLKEASENAIEQDRHTSELITQNRTASIEDEFTRSQIDLANKTQIQIDAENDLYNKKLISKEQYEQNVKLINDNADIEQEKLEKTKQDRDNILAREKIQLASDTLSIIGDVLGKETAAGKALAIASALINTYLGITAALKLGPVAAIAGVVSASAIGFKAVKNIMATKVPGGGGASAPAMGNMSAPIMPQAQTTTLSTQSINQIGVASSRAFVLETDVTNNQERIQRLNRAARIN